MHYRVFFFLALWLVALAAPLLAVGEEHEVAVALKDGAVDILFSDLEAAGSGEPVNLSLVRPPTHGQLTVELDRFVFTPNSSFWSVEVDSFVYRTGSPSEPTDSLVALYADRLQTEAMREPFEDNAIVAGYAQSTGSLDSLDLTTEAELEGVLGLDVNLDGGHAYLTVGSSGSFRGGEGNGGSVSTAMGCIPDPLGDSPLVVLAIDGDPVPTAGLPPSLRVVTGGGGLTLELLTLDGQWEASDTIPLVGDRVFIEVEWWYEQQSLDALLRVNGLAALVDAAANPIPFQAVHLGLVPLDPAATPPLEIGFDDLTIYQDNGLTNTSPVHAMRDFETGDTSNWPGSHGVGLSVTPGSAVSGGYGLKADVDFGSYLLEDAPSATRNTTSTMRIDLSQFTMTHGDISAFYSFGSRADNQSPGANDLRLRFYGGYLGVPRIFAVFAESGVARWSSQVPIPTGESELTLQYRAATSSDHPNGYLRLWLNGVPAFEMIDLDSAGKEVEWSNFGSYTAHPNPAISGYLSLDDFISSGR